MTLTRRRFLSISAACVVATPGMAATHRWQGRALGAEVEITIKGPKDTASPILTQAQSLLRQVEAQFNLFDPASALSRLNATGQLREPDPMFLRLIRSADHIHHATGGLFDPTVQPLWRALATGADGAAARQLIGWNRVQFDQRSVVLGTDQSMTFNGIAQGFATDLVVKALHNAGLSQTLVNIGEFRGTGGPWTLGLKDPEFGFLGTRTIKDSAVATSSPQALPLGGYGHILHTSARPQWSTVSVEASTATIADGFSTALTMAPLPMIKTLVGHHGLARVTVVDDQGDVTTV